MTREGAMPLEPGGLPRRWPTLVFVVLPFVSILVLGIALAMALISLSEMGVATNPRILQLFLAVRGVLIWVLPVVLSGLFAMLAHRHRMPLRWPLFATFVICTIAALVNVDLALNPPGGQPGGQLDIGLGLSVDAIPAVLLRVLATAAAVILPLLVARRRSMRSSPG